MSLDIIRFLAAAMVMWFHLAYWQWAAPNSTGGQIVQGVAPFPFLASSSWWGWVGVEIFFVLSGFVIAFSSERKTAFTFARGRFLRLYPAVWICASMSLLVLIALQQDGLLNRYIRSITIWPSPPYVDGVYWTLSVEMAFYGVVFLLLLLNRYEKLKVTLCLIGVPSVILWGLWHVGIDYESLRSARWAKVFLIPYGCFFALGGLLYLNYRERLSKRYMFAVAVFVVVGATEIFVTASERSDEANGLVPVIIWAVAVLMMAVGAAKNDQLYLSLRRFQPGIRLAGLATYPLYLLHYVPGSAIIKWTRAVGVDPLASLFLAVSISIALSFLVAGVLEEPLRKGVARLVDKAFVRNAVST